MSTIRTNIVNYFEKIEELTNTNLKLLKAINESFVSNRNNVSVSVNDVTYTIPSCFSIENKLNSLQNTIDNIINIPSTGEAWYNVNGNTRALELKSYACAPNAVNLTNAITEFSISSNNPMRELLSPVPVITFDVSLPNDIFEVKVRKIIAKSDRVKQVFDRVLDGNCSVSASYTKINSLISVLSEDEYEIYDKIHKLDTKTSNEGEGKYVIENIVDTYIDSDGYEIYELKVVNDYPLTYKKFDGTIEKPLLAGCQLRNFDGTAKVQIINVDNINSLIKIKLITQDALNLIPLSESDNEITDYSTLYYFNGDSIYSTNGIYDSKIKVSLEEDKYIYTCIAVINSRLNTQSEWGDGVLINTSKLTMNDGTSFIDYYNNNVKNLGDSLFEMSASLLSPITSLSSDVYNALINVKPVINDDMLKVDEINTHLKNENYNDALFALNSLNTRYNNAMNVISSIGSETLQIDDPKYSDLQSALNTKDTCIKEYTSFFEAYDTNDILSYTPKYRVRGFIVPSITFNESNITFNSNDYSIQNDNIIIHLIGMQIQYCYNNKSTLPEKISIYNNTYDADSTFTYPIWTEMPTQFRQKTLNYKNNRIDFSYSNDSNSVDVKFNQVDIPITPNESVKIRVRFIYSIGQPFNTITTKWSDSININFDKSLLAFENVSSVIDIANDNMINIKANNIIASSGINDHIKYSQTKTGFVHHADHIDSGFISNDNNIIPLRQKLQELSDMISNLEDLVGNDIEDIEVKVSIGNDNIVLNSNSDNSIYLESYNTFKNLFANVESVYTGVVESGGNSGTNNGFNSNLNSGTNSNLNSGTNSDSTNDLIALEKLKLYNSNYKEFKFANGVVSTMLNISIKNTGNKNIRLYSLFPGNRDVLLNKSKSAFVNISDYCINKNNIEGGVWMMYVTDDLKETKGLQTQNQFITFRINDVWTKEEYYSPDGSATLNNLQNSNDIDAVTKGLEKALVIYPYLSNKYSLCLESNTIKSYLIVKPGEELVIPMYCEYVVSNSLDAIKKTISFDIRTSLYSDPINYTFTVHACNTVSLQSAIASTNRKTYWNNFINKLGNGINNTFSAIKIR